MTKSFLITGITGFLGSRLAKACVEKGYQVVGLKRISSDCSRLDNYINKIALFNTDEHNLADVFEQYNFDAIVHCATDYGKEGSSLLQIVKANILFPIELIELAGKYAVEYFINTDTMLPRYVSSYALTKKQFLEWLKALKTMKIINVAIEYFFGPEDDENKFVAKVIRDLINETPQIDLTLGEQKRNFIYIDDVIEAYLLVMSKLEQHKAPYTSYEVGMPANISIKEFVEKIKIICKNKSTNLEFGALPYRENEVMESKVDTTALSGLGWQPKFTLDSSLKITIDSIAASRGR
ncbi:NAD-dependent epimerase/dehydratase family protein [Candidatus Margulisiibacteriota bacterium]